MLGRKPRSANELVMIYAGVLPHGTVLSAAESARMRPLSSGSTCAGSSASPSSSMPRTCSRHGWPPNHRPPVPDGRTVPPQNTPSASSRTAGEINIVQNATRLSPEFKAMCHDNDIRGAHGEAVKHIRHPVLGPIAFELSAFAVDGRTDLTLVIYNPATAEDPKRIASLLT
jgi:hypothetical protein